ncbi:hypothetical protein V1514DRAFT_289351 [Lipomyces japonicus]|uniref:uncharacterized protein n=1 Tax=Lipomyces japonicus TaxID=56871 RepID=UPI0034CE1C11
MTTRVLYNTLSRNSLHLLKESIRPHLPTCEFPDFLRLPNSAFQSADKLHVPKGWHFVYFNDHSDERVLFNDGYEPVSKFPWLNGTSQRRWAGGEIKFCRPLVSDHAGQCRIEKSVELLGSKHGWKRVDEITVRKLSNNIAITSDVNRHVAVEETRKLVFSPLSMPSVNSKGIRVPYSAELSTTLTPTSVLAFRFSALTFNAHKIHLDPQYASKVEFLPNIILQGSLSLILLMSWIQFDPHVRSTVGLDNEKEITNVAYSCIQHILLNSEIQLCISKTRSNKQGDDQWRIWIEQDGTVRFKGTIVVRQSYA